MNSFVQSLLTAGFYKKNQGKKVRQGTGYALALIFIVAAYQLQGILASQTVSSSVSYIISGLVLLLGAWISYRVVNWPTFADFLISVEAEMNKVSWPTRTELIRSSIVVLIVLFLIGLILYLYDAFWFILIQLTTTFLNYLFIG